jgi:hypothetical protein
MSSLAWTDSIGAATLSNGKAAPGTRFGLWTPRRRPVGPSVVAMGTGVTHRFEFRRDDTVSLEIAAIPNTKLDEMRRLKAHLLSGGTVAVTSDRELAADFANSVIAPGTTPGYEMTDRATNEYTFAVTLKAVPE